MTKSPGMKTKLALCLVGLSLACVSGPVGLRPGSNVALPAPAPSIAAEIIGGVIGDATGKREPQGEKGDPCRQRTDSLGPRTRPPAAARSAPRMRARAPMLINRR